MVSVEGGKKNVDDDGVVWVVEVEEAVGGVTVAVLIDCVMVIGLVVEVEVVVEVKVVVEVEVVVDVDWGNKVGVGLVVEDELVGNVGVGLNVVDEDEPAENVGVGLGVVVDENELLIVDETGKVGVGLGVVDEDEPVEKVGVCLVDAVDVGNVGVPPSTVVDVDWGNVGVGLNGVGVCFVLIEDWDTSGFKVVVLVEN